MNTIILQINIVSSVYHQYSLSFKGRLLPLTPPKQWQPHHGSSIPRPLPALEETLAARWSKLSRGGVSFSPRFLVTDFWILLNISPGNTFYLFCPPQWLFPRGEVGPSYPKWRPQKSQSRGTRSNSSASFPFKVNSTKYQQNIDNLIIYLCSVSCMCFKSCFFKFFTLLYCVNSNLINIDMYRISSIPDGYDMRRYHKRGTLEDQIFRVYLDVSKQGCFKRKQSAST